LESPGNAQPSPRIVEKTIQMMIAKTEAECVQPVAPQISRVALARRGVRRAVLRYLRWRTVSQLRQLDPRTLRDLGLGPAELMSVVCGLEIDDARRRNRFP
jgi:uncharacterized protein YjiS (DUF1127 family)